MPHMWPQLWMKPQPSDGDCAVGILSAHKIHIVTQKHRGFACHVLNFISSVILICFPLAHWHWNTLQHTATLYNTPCNILQHTTHHLSLSLSVSLCLSLSLCMYILPAFGMEGQGIERERERRRERESGRERERAKERENERGTERERERKRERKSER